MYWYGWNYETPDSFSSVLHSEIQNDMSQGKALLTKFQMDIAFIPGVLFFRIEERCTIVRRMILENEADSYVWNPENLIFV